MLLPKILGNYIDEGDEVWNVYLAYLLMREVTDLVLSPTVTKSSLSYLEGLIFQFLTHYVSLFGSRAITPKHHYMIHYPRLIGMHGPLRHLWCMRFEAKHQYFKSVISSLGNYVNVTATMATRHQMRQCWDFTSSDFLSGEPCPLKSTICSHLANLVCCVCTILSILCKLYYYCVIVLYMLSLCYWDGCTSKCI